MTLKRVFIMASFLAHSAFLCGATLRGTHTVTNTVVDAYTARPIEGARVFHTWHRAGVAHRAETTTDADGVAVTEFPADAHEPRVGISTARYTPLSFSPTNTHYTHELIPTRTYTVRGVVRTEEGEAIANAHVFLAPDDAAWAETIRGCDAWSDDEGGFVMHAVPVAAGDASVHVTAPSYVSIRDARYRSTPSRGGAFLNVQLEQGIRIHGRVVRDNGLPVDGARVWVRLLGEDEHTIEHFRLVDAPFDPIPGCVAYTLSDGSFSIQGVPASAYFTVHADHPDTLPAMHNPLSGRADDIPAFRLMLPTNRAWLRLRLRDARGLSLTNPVVTVQRRFTTRTPQGVFQLYRQLPVAYEVLENNDILTAQVPVESAQLPVQINVPGYRELLRSVPVRTHRTNTVELTLQEASKVVVTLYDAFLDTPVTNAVVISSTSTNRPDAHGRITYMLYEPKDCVVHAPGYNSFAIRIRDNLQEQHILFPRRISFNIHVCTPDGSPPEGGGEFNLSFILPDVIKSAERAIRGRISTDGRLGLDTVNVLSPEVQLRVRTRESETVVTRTFSHDALHCSLTITQFFPRLMHLRVPQPKDNRDINIEIVQSSGRIISPTPTENQEEFTFLAHVAEKYTINVSSEGYRSINTNITITADAKDNVIEMPYPTELIPRIYFELPAAYTNLQIQTSPLSLSVTDQDHGFYYVLQRNNQIYASFLPPDENKKYTVRVDQWGEWHTIGPFTLKDSPVQIDLPPVGAIEGQVDFPDTYISGFIKLNTTRALSLSDSLEPGPFHITHVPYGNYTLYVRVPQYGKTNISVTVDSDLIDVGMLRITHMAHATLRGSIRIPQEHDRARGYIAEKTPRGFRTPDPGFFPLDDDGSFVLTKLIPGEELYLYWRDTSGVSTVTNLFIPPGDTDIGDIP